MKIIKRSGSEVTFDLKKIISAIEKVVRTGVTLQKVPDRAFDRTGTNLTYTLLAATITEQ